MTKERVVEVSREIAATPKAVFEALTHSLELSYWFCHQAWTEPKVGGDFMVRWRNGWWAHGVYQVVEKPQRVVLTWLGKDEPGETEVAFEIEPVDQGSLVKVVHGGYGSDAVWDKAVAEAERSWPDALENLESVLTTGVDLREASRPILGIVPDELTEDRAAKENIATERGIYLASVIEEGGAAEAGLRKGDVITSISGMAVTDLDSLTTTLSPHRAGDRVAVSYVRGLERGTVTVELRPRPTPEISFDPHKVVGWVREEQAGVMAELRETVAEMSDEEAGKRPSADEWSVKETLAHLVLSERFTQRRFVDIISGTTEGQYGGDPTVVPEALDALLTVAPTVEALLDRLECEIEETLALFAALRPETVAMKGRYHAMATALQFWSFHGRDHVNQIRATLQVVRGQQG